MNRFRSWLPLTAAGRQSVWFCLRSMSIRCGLLRTARGRGYRFGNRRTPRLSALRRSIGAAPRSPEPVRWGAGTGCLSHSDGQQPTQPVEGFSAPLQGRRYQVSGQLPAMVSAYRTGERLAPHLPRNRNHRSMHTICKLSLEKRRKEQEARHSSVSVPATPPNPESKNNEE